MVVLAASCWARGAGLDTLPIPAPPDRSLVISPTFHSSLPFGPAYSETASKRSQSADCVAGQSSRDRGLGLATSRRHLSPDLQLLDGRCAGSIVPQQTVYGSERSKSDIGMKMDRGRRHLRHGPEDGENILAEGESPQVLKSLEKCRRGEMSPGRKSVARKETNFFELQADNSTNRRHRPWVARYGAVTRGRSAPAAITPGRGRDPIGMSPAGCRPRDQPLNTPIPVAAPCVEAAPCANQAIAPSAEGAPCVVPPLPSPSSDAPKRLGRSASPGMRPTRSDKPGCVWGSGCRKGAVAGVGMKDSLTTSITSARSPGGQLFAPATAETSAETPSKALDAGTAITGAGNGPSSQRLATPRITAKPLAAFLTPRTRGEGLRTPRSNSQGSGTRTQSAPTVAPAPKGFHPIVASAALDKAAPHRNSMGFRSCTRYSNEAPPPKSPREQPHHSAQQIQALLNQALLHPLPCGTEERLLSSACAVEEWRSLTSPRLRKYFQWQPQLITSLQGPEAEERAAGGEPLGSAGAAGRQVGASSPSRKKRSASTPVVAPYAHVSNEASSSHCGKHVAAVAPYAHINCDSGAAGCGGATRQIDTYEKGSLYLAHDVALLARGQLQLRGAPDPQAHTTAEGALVSRPDDYALTVHQLPPSALRSFSKRLQESNLREKESMYQSVAATKNRKPALKLVPARHGGGYDPQTGRPNRNARIVAPQYSGNTFHLPLPASKTGPTPATSVATTVTPRDHVSVDSH